MSSSVARVHTDNTPTSARLKIDEIVDRGIVPQDAIGPSSRAAIINVWRAYGTGRKVTSMPLGCVKYDTIAPQDTFPYVLAHENKCGVNGSISYAPGHAWHFYEAMTPDEVLTFINYEEADDDGTPPRQVYHAALSVLDDDGRADETVAEERVSFEVRVLALLPRSTRA